MSTTIFENAESYRKIKHLYEESDFIKAQKNDGFFNYKNNPLPNADYSYHEGHQVHPFRLENGLKVRRAFPKQDVRLKHFGENPPNGPLVPNTMNSRRNDKTIDEAHYRPLLKARVQKAKEVFGTRRGEGTPWRQFEWEYNPQPGIQGTNIVKKRDYGPDIDFNREESYKSLPAPKDMTKKIQISTYAHQLRPEHSDIDPVSAVNLDLKYYKQARVPRNADVRSSRKQEKGALPYGRGPFMGQDAPPIKAINLHRPKVINLSTGDRSMKSWIRNPTYYDGEVLAQTNKNRADKIETTHVNIHGYNKEEEFKLYNREIGNLWNQLNKVYGSE